MIQLPDDRRPPLTPQLALRVAVIGSFALAMFAIIFFRLWFLQVLSTTQYAHAASVNRVRNVSVPAPRGDIVDRSGTILVQSVQEPAVLISPPDLPVPITDAVLADPPGADQAVYNRLAVVLGMSRKPTPCKFFDPAVMQDVKPRLSPIACAVSQEYAQLPYANVTVQSDVKTDVQYYLQERQDEFPGVEVQQQWVRTYPLGSIAAQLFGLVGRITKPEVGAAHYRGASESDVVGQSGLEYYYDRYLRGQDGTDRVEVDALGNPVGDLSGIPPTQGLTLKLAIDVNLQRAGQAALQEAIDDNPPATAGAFVAMDPQDGEVYALGSLPTYNANDFSKPLSTAEYRGLNNALSGYPLIDRAVQSAYPTGSTFKAITSTAALESGAWGLGETYDDTGVYENGPGDIRHNAGHAAYGVLDIVDAIKFSSDDFFYNLGALMNSEAPQGGALQKWARLYGIGQPTGIDVGGENPGILPTPAWRAHVDKEEAQCEHKKHVPSCGIADGRPWSVGDDENLAVGQGDLEATPLQLAVAYSALENNGTVVTPHVGLEVDSGDGTLLQRIEPPSKRHFTYDEQYRDAILEGLREAASQSGGTSADVFAGFPEQVYGKTGTAERGLLADQSWYVCFVPSWVTGKPILVVVTVEQGGFGAQAAAPAARQILSQWFFGKRGPFVVGQSKTL